MVLYFALIFGSREVLNNHRFVQHIGIAWQTVIAVAPLIPLILLFVAIIRFTLRMDELQRRIHVTSLAISGGATAMLAVTYGLMEGEVFPHPSAWYTYAVFMMGWVVAVPFVRRRYQ